MGADKEPDSICAEREDSVLVGLFAGTITERAVQ